MTFVLVLAVELPLQNRVARMYSCKYLCMSLAHCIFWLHAAGIVAIRDSFWLCAGINSTYSRAVGNFIHWHLSGYIRQIIGKYFVGASLKLIYLNVSIEFVVSTICMCVDKPRFDCSLEIKMETQRQATTIKDDKQCQCGGDACTNTHTHTRVITTNCTLRRAKTAKYPTLN